MKLAFKLTFVFVLCLSHARADHFGNCANVAGRYTGGQYIFDVTQRGCDVASNYNIGGFSHALSVNLRGNQGYGAIYRTNLINHCETRLSVVVNILGRNQLEILTAGSDGYCDLPQNFTQRAVLTRTQGPGACPNIAGRYYGGPYVFDIFQQGCKISSSYYIGGFSHVLSSNLRGNVGFGSIDRTNLNDYCRTRLNIQVNALSRNEVEILTTGSDGYCDLPYNFTQRVLLTR